MGVKRKECIFCRADLRSKERAREHIVPRWLIHELGLGSGGLTSTHFDGSLAVQAREMTPETFLAGHVCRVCNNGWMSSLEVRFAPIFRDLTWGHRRIQQLSLEERRTVATWTLKTLGVLNWAAGYIQSVPPAHLQVLVVPPHDPPPNVFVISGSTARGAVIAAAQEDFVLASRSQWQPRDTDREVRLPNDGYYKLGIQLGSLLLAVFFWPFTLWHVELSAGAHQVVWPRARLARPRVDRRNDRNTLERNMNRATGPGVLASFLRGIRVRDHTIISALAAYWRQAEESGPELVVLPWAEAGVAARRLHEALRRPYTEQPTILVEDQPRDLHVVSFVRDREVSE